MRIQSRRVEQDGSLPRGLLQGLGHVLDHLFDILVEHWVMLHDQKAMVILLQDGHELEGCEGPADLQLGDFAVEPAEYAGVVARDVEDLVSLQV